MGIKDKADVEVTKRLWYAIDDAIANEMRKGDIEIVMVIATLRSHLKNALDEAAKAIVSESLTAAMKEWNKR